MIINHGGKSLSSLVLKEIKIKIRCKCSSIRWAYIKENASTEVGKDVGKGNFHIMLESLSALTEPFWRIKP